MTDEIKELSLKIRQLNIEIMGLKHSRYRTDKKEIFNA